MPECWFCKSNDFDELEFCFWSVCPNCEMKEKGKHRRWICETSEDGVISTFPAFRRLDSRPFNFPTPALGKHFSRMVSDADSQVHTHWIIHKLAAGILVTALVVIPVLESKFNTGSWTGQTIYFDSAPDALQTLQGLAENFPISSSASSYEVNCCVPGVTQSHYVKPFYFQVGFELSRTKSTLPNSNSINL